MEGVCVCKRGIRGERNISLLFLYQRFLKAKDLGHEPDLRSLSR